MPRVLIVGATSAIAEATARLFARDGASLFLAARSARALAHMEDDLRVRGAASVRSVILDVNDVARHESVVDEAVATLGGLDVVLVAHGTLPNQAACIASVAAAEQELRTNFLSTVSLLTIVANRMEAQGHGTIAVITSVAGERGRASNYVYGAAKGGVSIFLQGLRHRLAATGIKVIDIRPGFVDTPMTASLKKGPLWSSAARVASDIHRAVATGKDVVYTPWFWRWIMLAIRGTPAPIFHKTRL
jgi:short-subunit dehydrogenase